MPPVVTLTPNPALDLWTSTERVERGTKLRCTGAEYDPGGGGINVSRVLHRLGAETVALYAAGGCAGDHLTQELRHEDVPARRIGIRAETRQNLNVAETSSGDVYRFVLPGAELGEADAEDLLSHLPEVVEAGALVVGSGSLPPGLRRTFWADAAAAARRAGGRFVLDSAHGVAPALEAGVYLLRLNHEEAAAVAGRRMKWPHELADWASARVESGGAGIAIVTEAAEGALIATRDGRLRVSPPSVEVRSAIGAGDSFVGGFCLGLLRDEPPGEALRRAVATAAATLLTPGTELCRPDDVARLLDETGPAEPV